MYEIQVLFKAVGMQSAKPGCKTPYSPDIGWKLVWQQLGMEMQFRHIARRLQIATSTAHRISNDLKNVEMLHQASNLVDCMPEN